jgi:hypothetical protein
LVETPCEELKPRYFKLAQIIVIEPNEARGEYEKAPINHAQEEKQTRRYRDALDENWHDENYMLAIGKLHQGRRVPVPLIGSSTGRGCTGPKVET